VPAAAARRGRPALPGQAACAVRTELGWRRGGAQTTPAASLPARANAGRSGPAARSLAAGTPTPARGGSGRRRRPRRRGRGRARAALTPDRRTLGTSWPVSSLVSAPARPPSWSRPTTPTPPRTVRRWRVRATRSCRRRSPRHRRCPASSPSPLSARLQRWGRRHCRRGRRHCHTTPLSSPLPPNLAPNRRSSSGAAPWLAPRRSSRQGRGLDLGSGAGAGAVWPQHPCIPARRVPGRPASAVLLGRGSTTPRCSHGWKGPLPVRGEVLHRWKAPLPLRGEPWMEGPPACACVLSAMGSWEKRKREREQGAVIWKGRERWSAVARKPRSRMERSAIEGSRDCSRMERSAAGGRDARKPRRRWRGGWQNRAPLVMDVYTTYLCSSRDETS
jgi:hypothetical protein